jgi:hypothetical protein
VWVSVTCLLSAVAAGCADKVPREALQLSPESLQNRQLETRKFDTRDERALLVAAAGLLQDMGYTIEESETKLGLIVGSKERDATDAGQVTGAVIMALLGSDVPYDSQQQIRASLVTRPSPSSPSHTLLRATFQRLVWNNKGVLWKREPIHDAAIYVEFFDKLSKAVFLEAHSL